MSSGDTAHQHTGVERSSAIAEGIHIGVQTSLYLRSAVMPGAASKSKYEGLALVNDVAFHQRGA